MFPAVIAYMFKWIHDGRWCLLGKHEEKLILNQAERDYQTLMHSHPRLMQVLVNLLEYTSYMYVEFGF